MAFFPSSSGLVINGGNFTSFNFQTEGPAAKHVLGKGKGKDSDGDSLSCRRHRNRVLDGLMILKAGDVELRRELISDDKNSYRIHAASHRGRLVAVKTFEGPRAKQDWEVNVAFSKKCLHPNVLQIVGISDESSKSHFIQFHGITSEQKMQLLIANSLGIDLYTSVQISMKAVKGIAAGLSYIKSRKIPVMYAGTMNNNQKWNNFDILTGYDNEPIIVFHLPSTICEDGSVSQNLDIETDSRGIEVLNGLCDQLFSGANSMLYDDSPERDFDLFDSEDRPVATPEHEESTSNRSNQMENPKPSRKPRREVWWLDLGTTNHSLMSVGRCFEDRLNWSLLSSSNSLLPHIRSPKDDNLRQNLHQCPGYLREEIALTCDLSKSAIVSHAFPGPSERCSICHQLVQYTYSDSFDPNNIYVQNNSLSLPPTEGELTFNLVDFDSGQTSGSRLEGPVDYDRQCGVINDKNLPCSRSLTCKSHSMSAKRAVQGRSRNYDDLLLQWQRANNPNFVEPVERETNHTDATNQQTQHPQHPATHVLASSDANNNQAPLRLQLNRIGRLGSLIFGKNTKRSLSDIFGGDKSHKISIPPVDETLPAVSFPSRNHAQSSSMPESESSPTRAQNSREVKINKKFAELLLREKMQEKYMLAERRQRQMAREVLQKRQKLIGRGFDGQSHAFTAAI